MEFKPYAFVKCYGDRSVGYYGCGIVGLSMDEYSQQLSRPDSFWQCPNCGCQADYQDTLSEEAQQNYTE